MNAGRIFINGGNNEFYVYSQYRSRKKGMRGDIVYFKNRDLTKCYNAGKTIKKITQKNFRKFRRPMGVLISSTPFNFFCYVLIRGYYFSQEEK